MARVGPNFSDEEKEQIFKSAIGAFRYRRSGIFDGREVRRIAFRLGENPETVRARLQKAGYELIRSRSGSRGVWKKQESQSPHIENLED